MPFAHVLFICVPSQCTNNNYASILSLEEKKQTWNNEKEKEKDQVRKRKNKRPNSSL